MSENCNLLGKLPTKPSKAISAKSGGRKAGMEASKPAYLSSSVLRRICDASGEAICQVIKPAVYRFPIVDH